MGLRAITLARMERYVQRVQQLVLGETITWSFEGQDRDIGFLNPEFDLVNTKDPIPLHVSALGPKARRMAAKLGGFLGFPNLDSQSRAALVRGMMLNLALAGLLVTPMPWQAHPMTPASQRLR